MPADDVGICMLSFLFLCLTLGGFFNSFYRANSLSLFMLPILSARQGYIDLCLLLNLSSTRKVLQLNIFSCHAIASSAQWVTSKALSLFWDKLLQLLENGGHCHSSITLMAWQKMK